MEFEFATNIEVPEAEFETRVPSDYRQFYTKGNDGVYKVGEGIATTAAGLIDGLGKTLKGAKTTNQQVGLESKQRREALEKWQALGESPEFVQTQLAELNDKLAKGAKINPEEIKAAIAKDYETKIKAGEDANATMFRTLEKHLRDNAALTAISEHKGNAKLLMPVILSATKVVQGDDGEYFTAVLNEKGEIRAGADGNPLPVSKLVAELKEHADYKIAFEGTKQNGDGKPPGNQQQQQQRHTPPANNGQRELRGASRISAALNG